MDKQTTVLIMIDGYGKSTEKEGNAISNANKPNIDKLLKKYPNASVEAGGVEVGLPVNCNGNSEAGYSNIGAGRIIEQSLTTINKSIESGDFFSIDEFSKAIDNCKKNNTKLHLVGLLSDGGIHSHERHLFALLELAKRKGLDDVYVHCFMDGVDTLPASGENYIQKLEEKMKEKGVGKIATIIGRYYSMDKTNNWDRIKKAYDAMVYGKGEYKTSAIQAIEDSYQKEVFDEFVEPTIVCSGNKPLATIDNGDSLIFYNFRADRLREIAEVFCNNRFDKFEKKKMKLFLVSMTKIGDGNNNSKVAFKHKRINNTLSEVIYYNKLKQLIISEYDELYNTTFFFFGDKKIQLKDDDIALDRENKKGVKEITNKVINAIENKKYDFILVEFASINQSGHTGNIDLVEKEIEILDDCIGKIVETINKNDCVGLITSDHGNVEQMLDYKTGEPCSSNTSNNVPIVLIGIEKAQLKDGKLCDIAPTLLDIMNLKKPKDMKGQSLLERG